MLKRLLHGLGIATMLASPMWITMRETPSYVIFAMCLVAGILLLILASKVKADDQPGR